MTRGLCKAVYWMGYWSGRRYMKRSLRRRRIY